MLLFSLILTAFSVSHPLFIGVLGRGIPFLFTGAGYAALPVLMLAWFSYRHSSQSAPWETGMKFRTILLASAIGLLTLFGWLNGNTMRHVFDDAWCYIYFLFAILLGTRDDVWEDIERPLLAMFCVSFALVIWGLSLDRGVLSNTGGIMLVSDAGAERRWIRTAGYEFGRVLGFWPLVVMMNYFRRGTRAKAIGVLIIVAFLCLQVVFQKRAPFVRTILYATVLIIFPLVNRRQASPASAISVIFALGLTLFTISTTDVFRQLIGRYVSDDPVAESSRILEARSLLADLDWHEYIYGRGMGGYFFPPEDWDAGNVEIAPGVMGRTALHVGILVPVLKGGLVFWTIVYCFFLPALFRRAKVWYSNRYNMCALAILPVYMASQVIEGAPGIPNIFDALMVGLAAGRIGLAIRDNPRAPSHRQGLSTMMLSSPGPLLRRQ